jgi:hypothetical protein
MGNLRPTRRRGGAERIGAVPRGPLQEPAEEPAPPNAEGQATGLTAEDEELPGWPEDRTVAVIAAVCERGGIALELLTPFRAKDGPSGSLGSGRGTPGPGACVGNGGCGHGVPRPGTRASSTAGSPSGGTSRCSRCERTVNSDSYLRLVEGVEFGSLRCTGGF